MPELPDVALFQQTLEDCCLRQQIARVRVPEPAVLSNISPAGLGRRLAGRQFTASRRRGKNLFAQTDDRRFLRLHFGMTGYIQPLPASKPAPEHTRVEFQFEGGNRLAFVMMRKLGALEPIDDLDQYLREAGLGPDALDPEFDFSAFRSTLENRRGMVKSTLMNQEVIAGLGNVYVDEILFQARMHPRKPLPHLSEGELGHLFHTMKRVLKIAIERRAQPDALPAHWLILHRHREATCPRCGRPIGRIDVSGRRGYYCPRCQPK